MPTYQYKCPECGHEFEEFQPITDKAIEICPKCKGKTRRLISGGAGLIFKGSGFYITDYRSDSYNKSAKADSATSADSSGGSSGSTSGNTAKKSETKSAAAKPAKSSESSKPASSKKK